MDTTKATTYRPLRLVRLQERRGFAGREVLEVQVSLDPRTITKVEPVLTAWVPSGTPHVFVNLKGEDGPMVAKGSAEDVTDAWEAALRGAPLQACEWGAEPTR